MEQSEQEKLCNNFSSYRVVNTGCYQYTGCYFYNKYVYGHAARRGHVYILDMPPAKGHGAETHDVLYNKDLIKNLKCKM